MKKIGFVGGFDKTNLIMYVAKVLQNMDKKVLVIDGTILQKMRYIAPTISRSKMYVTEFEMIDFAVGFQNMEQIAEYLQNSTESDTETLPYDYILVDVDNRIALRSFDVTEAEKLYYVTGFDIYSLKRGMDILNNLEEQLKFTKVLYSNDITKEDEEYLNYLSIDKNIIWDDTVIYCPLLDADNKVIEENQRVDKIRVKRLSNDYQQGITYVVQNILDENIGKIKKSIIE